ncbi:MAG: cytochrome c3 family protein [Chloroflexota bacterium]
MKVRLLIVLFIAASIAMIAQMGSGGQKKAAPARAKAAASPKAGAKGAAANVLAARGPDIVLMNQNPVRFDTVVFSHKMHAQMHEMSGGCENCHHHNSTGKIQKCSNCHESRYERGDVRVPELKSAYHRLCIQCHRQWSGQTECYSCHSLKKDKKANVAQRIAALKDKSHPTVERPNIVKFNTKSDQGATVNFKHNMHIESFGYSCNTCHQNENCMTCHSKGDPKTRFRTAKTIRKNKTFADQHAKCYACHADDGCKKCHGSTDMSSSFNHAKTGFTLEPFHSSLDCKRCHTRTNPFSKPPRDCNACHKNWKQGSFNHAVTGLKLSADHVDFECEQCHVGRKFNVKPVCAECHDDKSYPAQKPGTLVGRRKK